MKQYHKRSWNSELNNERIDYNGNNVNFHYLLFFASNKFINHKTD